MESRSSGIPGRGFWLSMSVLLCIIAGCAGSVEEGNRSAEPIPGKRAPAQLQPGLSVVYIFQKYRNVDQIPVGDAALRMGRQGRPVTILNHQSGKEQSVFGSGRSQGVGMVMDGFLNLEKVGTYRWQALANDGIRMFIDNQMIFEDPKVHKDRLTPPGELRIDRPGKYPVHILYFQRKGTAALKLYWQPPGSAQFSLVPAEVYWH